MAFQNTERWFQRVSGQWREEANPPSQRSVYPDGYQGPPLSLTPAQLADPEFMWGQNWAQLWRDEGTDPGYSDPVDGPIAENAAQFRLEQVVNWVLWDVPKIREAKQAEITAQVPTYSVTDYVIDPVTEEDVRATGTGANERLLELEETSDEEVVGFDPRIIVNNPNTESRANFSCQIVDNLPEWEGAPGVTTGFRAVLKIIGENGNTADGGEARLLVVAAPSDVGAVLPFTQPDAVNRPQIWECISRKGHRWQDPELGCAVQLLWGLGSVPVSPTLVIDKLGKRYRQATIVRYGVDAGARSRRGRDKGRNKRK